MQFFLNQPKSDCIYHFLIDFELNKILFGSESIPHLDGNPPSRHVRARDAELLSFGFVAPVLEPDFDLVGEIKGKSD